MITFLLIVCIIELFLIVFLSRFLWLIISYSYYIKMIKEYITKHEITDNDTILEYYQVWPFVQVLIHFWDFNLRNFVCNQDLYYKVLNYYNITK